MEWVAIVIFNGFPELIDNPLFVLYYKLSMIRFSSSFTLYQRNI